MTFSSSCRRSRSSSTSRQVSMFPSRACRFAACMLTACSPAPDHGICTGMLPSASCSSPLVFRSTLVGGDATPAILPQRAVLPDLLPALQDPRNWSTALPDGTTQAVTLSAPRPDDQTLRVHPIGVLSVRERSGPARSGDHALTATGRLRMETTSRSVMFRSTDRRRRSRHFRTTSQLASS